MKLVKSIWMLGFGLAGVIVIVTRETLAASLGLSPQSGPWVMVGAGIAIIALAIAPRFLFRRG